MIYYLFFKNLFPFDIFIALQAEHIDILSAGSELITCIFFS
jgi:hypothetical protein